MDLTDIPWQRDLDAYPPLRLVRETDLLLPIRVERCACGRDIHQYFPATEQLVVAAHNTTTHHRAWSMNRDRED